MDDLNCCLSQVIHICLEASIFLNQLYKFEYQLSKFYSSYHIPSRPYFSILEHFSIIINDLNLYHKNHFLKLYSNIFNYLLRKHFTINYSNEIIDDFEHLNHLLNHHKKYYKNIFNLLHKLSITCLLCLQYRRLCTSFELTQRFVYIRIDLLTDLKKLNDEIQFLLVSVNSNFQQRRQICRKERIIISDLFRTIILWLVLVFSIGCYLLWLK